MKANFVVSAYQDMWLPNAQKLFAVDPYIAHVLKREERFADYDEVLVAPPSRSTREEFLHDHEFVDRKFHRYNDILAHRLDKLHGTCHGNRFWRKAFSLSILRHVSLCYDLFTVCEAYLNPMLHDCHVLDQESYRIPVDFDEHRQMFQNTDFGREQLFSVYCGLFYPGHFTTKRSGAPSSEADVACPTPQKSKSFLQRITQGQILYRILRRIRLLFSKDQIRRLLHLRSPYVGVMETCFPPERMDQLVFESWGRIQPIPLCEMPFSVSAPRWELREELIQDEPDFDRFDKFAFACLKYGMPKIFVEDFAQVYKNLNSHFNRYSDLRWVVCEWWIGQTLSALAMAILHQRGVKHIYNEHNYLAYPFLGNNLKYIIPLVDEFISLGWEDSSIPSLVRGASLFQWIESKESTKEHDLLFISSIPNTHAPEVNASYGESGARVVPSYLEMNRRFLETLDAATLSTMVFRAYPAWLARQALAWDQAFVLREYLSKVKLIDDTATPARQLMQRSRLTVINYLSTSYLEALISDVPTVFLWNKEAYILEDRHMGFFDLLIEARICHIDPVEAAHFVEQIKNDPDAWWFSPTVRRARAAFLKSNIGSPEVLVKHLIKHACEPHAAVAV